MAFATVVLIYALAEASRRSDDPVDRRDDHADPLINTANRVPVAPPPRDGARVPVTPTPIPAPRSENNTWFSGSVMNLQGQPIAGATVQVEYRDNGSLATAEAVTDAAGKFRVSNIGAKSADIITARADGYDTSVIRDVPLPFDGASFSLGRLGSAEVQILAASPTGAQSVPYFGPAEVYLQRSDESTTSPETDEQQQPFQTVEKVSVNIPQSGVFVFPELHAGTYRVAVAAAQEYGESGTFTVASGERQKAQVVIGVRKEMRGQVLDAATRAPIANAMLEVRATGRPQNVAEARVLSTQTDAAGAFAISGLRPGAYTLTAGADGYSTKSLERVTISADPGLRLRDQTLLLSAGTASLVVAVVDDAGKPVAASPVAVIGTGTPPRTYFGRSDVSGTVALPSIVAGTYTATATMPDNAHRQKSVTVEVGEAQQAQGEIRFGRIVKVAGIALRAGGPYQGLLSFVPRGGGPRVFGRADAAGAYAVELEPGEYLVAVENQQGKIPVIIPAAPTYTANVKLD